MKSRRLYTIIPVLVMVLLAATIVYASEGGGEGGSAVKDWKELGFRILNFVILAGLLWYWLKDKVKAYFTDRRNDIVALLDEMEKARVDARKHFAQYEEKFKNIEKETQEIRDLLKSEIESDKKRIAEEGKAASERIMEQAKAAADQEVIKARQDLRNYVVDLAGDMAVQIVAKSMQPKDQSAIIEEYLDKVAGEN